LRGRCESTSMSITGVQSNWSPTSWGGSGPHCSSWLSLAHVVSDTACSPTCHRLRLGNDSVERDMLAVMLYQHWPRHYPTSQWLWLAQLRYKKSKTLKSNFRKNYNL
jgi:hypothetical protein